MKALAITLLAALIVVVAVAAFAPASLVDARIASVTGGEVRLARAEGTLWRGRGMLSAADGRWRIGVAWTADLASLWRGVASFSLGSDEAADVRGSVTASPDRRAVVSLDATLPGAMVGGVGPAMGVATGGLVGIRAAQLTLDPSGGNGTIVADWSNARAQVGGLLVDLGTVTLRLAARRDTVAGPVTSQGGDVAIDGTVTLSDQRLDAQLRLMPRPSASPELRNALASLGAVDARGAVALRIDRSLR